MSQVLRIEPDGREVDVHPGESLLEAALNAGLPVAYGCSNGNCGMCRARLVSGEIVALRHSDHPMPAADRDAGWFLTCTHGAASDVVVATPIAGGSEDIAAQEIEVRVKRIEAIDGDTVRLQVQTPRTRRLRFLAGQDARLSRGEAGCVLPIASCPCDDRNLEFHVPADPERCPGSGSLRALKHGDRMRLNGPFGGFVLDAASNRPRLMVAAGIGLSPVKSIIEHSLALAPEVPVHLVLVQDVAHPHFLYNTFRSWRDALDGFDFEVVPPGDEPALEAALALAVPDTRDVDCYLAGEAAPVAAWSQVIERRGVPAARLSTRVF